MPGDIFEPDLKIGVTFALRQSSGTTPSSIERRKTIERGVHSMSAFSIRIRGQILSGPGAAAGFRAFIFSEITSVLISTSSVAPIDGLIV